MIFGDYHTHTTYSDGKSSILKNSDFAKERGLKEFVISDHGYNSILVGMTEKKWRLQQDEINAIKGIKVYHGIESNIDSFGDIDVKDKDLSKIDVLIVGFHRLISLRKMKGSTSFYLINGFASKKRREKEKKLNTAILCKAINKYPIDILAHINNRMLVDVKKVCQECARNNVFVELNAKHLDAIKDSIKDMISTSCNFILSTDSHKASEVGEFSKVMTFIEENNLPIDRIYGLDKVPTFKER